MTRQDIADLATALAEVNRWLFGPLLRGTLVTVVLALVTLGAGGVAERTGDRLQIALPLLALGCAAANGDARDFAVRFGAMFVAVHAVKRAGGEAAWNARPWGGSLGMPSAHTSAAVMGASRLAADCVARNPVAQAAALIGAGFVGTSRVEAGAHTIWQVLAGALAGLVFDRARPGRLLRTLRAALRGGQPFSRSTRPAR
jgi:membrane-associated phospholipid phosphatase